MSLDGAVTILMLPSTVMLLMRLTTPFFPLMDLIHYHRGHAYEATTTDVIARYHRLLGEACYFLTGTDEHGQKIANTAADMGKEPIVICDLYATGFQVLNQRILISNDDYLRTTSARHKRTAKEIWKRCAAVDDIYLDTYSGW
jgi:methionyl-tRNA synthetase